MTSRQTNSLDQYLVGLTGNICSGKSKAAEYFKELGAHIIDLDNIVHELYEKNIPLKFRLYNEFGYKIFNKKLEVDRKKLGRIVFSDKSKMKKLENMVWKYVEKERKKRTKNKEGIVIIEAAMLYESGLDKEFDKNIMVTVDEEQQVERLMKRNGIEKEEALKRISSQMPQYEKMIRSDYIIPNKGTLELLKRNVEDAWEFLNMNFLYEKHLFTPE